MWAATLRRRFKLLAVLSLYAGRAGLASDTRRHVAASDERTPADTSSDHHPVVADLLLRP